MTQWWIDEYKKFHREQRNYGSGGALKFHKQHIDDLIKDTKAETLLDFGCGIGIWSRKDLRQSFVQKITLYDKNNRLKKKLIKA